MNLLILGRGKTGALVAEVARECKHDVRVLGADENVHAAGLTADKLRGIDVVIDFTTPPVVVENIGACVIARKNMVVGTTGWYELIPRIRAEVEAAGIGVLYGANFSVGVNLLFDIVRTGAAALHRQYLGHIFERHHTHKKDAPSGTAAMLQRIIKEASGSELEITSFREGDVMGMHEVIFDSPNDTIYLCHDAKSRRGFAEGAVKGAKWIAGKHGFFDFRDIWREI
jgi:4-hydroxy-tetrahydrodipicolinate reductase